MGKRITEFTLYRWRYYIGYGLIILIFLLVLAIAGLYVPGALSPAEMQSVVQSDALSFSLGTLDPANIVNLPYHLLQKISLEILGVSQTSIKLPSLLLGLASAAGMLILLRMWFKQNVAVLTTVLVITTGQFLFVAQSGTPSIIYIFWSIWLLVMAMMVSRRIGHGSLWKIALFCIAALSLYTPLSVYILLALISAVILHPHLRYLVRRLSKKRLLIASGCALLLLLPLAYALYKDPSIGLTLLGIPDQWPNLQTNALQLLKQYFDFQSPNSGVLMTPIYGLGSMILIAIGIFRLITTKYTARSYITAAWVILLLPVLVINPNFISITFVPVILLMAMGISRLLNYWYRLFPRNPYARLAGLLPLTILIGGMVFSGLDRYMYGYLYNPETSGNFTKDLRILEHELTNKTWAKTTLVASSEEAPFYTVVARHRDDLSVTTFAPNTTDTIIRTKKVFTPDAENQPYRIITDGRTHDSDRFYVYKTDTK